MVALVLEPLRSNGAFLNIIYKSPALDVIYNSHLFGHWMQHFSTDAFFRVLLEQRGLLVYGVQESDIFTSALEGGDIIRLL